MMISFTTINVTRSSLSTRSSFTITGQAITTKSFIPCDIPKSVHSHILEMSKAIHFLVFCIVNTWGFACGHCWLCTKVMAFAKQIPDATTSINLFATLNSSTNSLNLHSMCHFYCPNSDPHFLLQPIPQAKHGPIFLVFSHSADVAYNLTLCKVLHQQTMQCTFPQLSAMLFG